jgi:hypothetical protein
MAAIDRPRLQPRRFDMDEPQDAAADAAHAIRDEARSIFLAVDEMAAKIGDAANRDADALARATNAAVAPALVRLEALSRPLDALSTDLDRMAEDWAKRGRHGT